MGGGSERMKGRQRFGRGGQRVYSMWFYLGTGRRREREEFLRCGFTLKGGARCTLVHEQVF